MALAGDTTESLEAPEFRGELFAAARRLNNGTYEAAVFDTDGRDVAVVPLPSRGHDVTVRPATGECVVFARRPGTYAVAYHRPDGLAPVPFRSATARHFYGHGVCSHDGRLLYTTENDFANARGIIGVRNADNGYRQIGEFFSHGTGPHDLALLSDGHTLVVANGGIVTHPEEGRRMLNVASMQPNIAYIDTRTGDLLEQHVLSPDLHKLSMRHLAVTPDDQVVVGCQFVGPKTMRPMLVATHRRQEDVALISAPGRRYGTLRNYVSSIATDQTGRYAMATSSKGSAALLFDLETRSITRQFSLADVSGVAARRGRAGFVTTSGTGATYVSRDEADGSMREVAVNPGCAWDNHLTALGSE